MGLTFTAIDFETANADPGSACSIGMTRVENGQVAGHFYSLIRPEPLAFSWYHIRVHGITQDMVLTAPRFADIWPEIESFVVGPLLAHNAAFDGRVLNSCLQDARLSPPAWPYACSVQVAKRVWKGLMSHRLNDMAAHLGIALEHHRADEDAHACAQIVIEAARLRGAESVESLVSSLGVKLPRLDDMGPIRRALPVTGAAGGERGHAQEQWVRAADIRAQTAVCREDHPLQGQVVVFTGELRSMSREEAMRRCAECGAAPWDQVTQKTTILVLGDEGTPSLPTGHVTGKMRRAQELLAKGYRLKILSETEFLNQLVS